MIKSRSDIKDFILDLESRFPVNDWQMNEIHLWPIIRNMLFFNLICHSEPNHSKENNSNVNLTESSFFKRTLNVLIESYKWVIKFNGLRNQNYLFFSPGHIRVVYNNKLYNRFFDSMIIKNNWHRNSYVFDYSVERTSNLPNYNKENFHNLIELNQYFKSYRKINSAFGLVQRESLNFELNDFEEFIIYLKQKNLVLFDEIDDIKKFKSYARSIYHNKQLFSKILKKTKPQAIYIICYYNPIMYSLLVSAKQLKIPVIELQHGPMSSIHMCYTNWNKVPENGYVFLPDNFYCWDQNSVDNMCNWTKNTDKHTVNLFGNPWIEFLDTNMPKIDLPNNSILYTLQPLVFDALFPEELIAVINTSKYFWLIRLHPRQLMQKDKLREFLKKKRVDHLVNIDEATRLPLPFLIRHCIVHITHFSGATIEAALLGKFTILLNVEGAETYKELVSSNDAIYLKMDTKFKSNFEKLIKQLT